MNNIDFPSICASRKLFGNFVRSKRQSQQISAKQLSSTLGISASYLRDIELGNRRVPKHRLQQIVRALRIPDDELSNTMILLENHEVTSMMIKTPI